MQDRLRQRRQDHFGASFRPEWDKKFRSGPSAGPSRPFAASSTASPSSNNQSKVLSPAVRLVNATGNHNHSVSSSENGSSSSSQTNVPASNNNNNNNANQAGKNNTTQNKGNSNGYGGGGGFDYNRPFNKKLTPQQHQQSNGSGGYNSNFNRPRMARKVQAGYRPRDMAYDGGKNLEV